MVIVLKYSSHSHIQPHLHSNNRNGYQRLSLVLILMLLTGLTCASLSAFGIYRSLMTGLCIVLWVALFVISCFEDNLAWNNRMPFLRYLTPTSLTYTSYLSTALFWLSGVLLIIHKLLLPMVYCLVLVLGMEDFNRAKAVIGFMGLLIVVAVVGRQLVITDAYLIENTPEGCLHPNLARGTTSNSDAKVGPARLTDEIETQPQESTLAENLREMRERVREELIEGMEAMRERVEHQVNLQYQKISIISASLADSIPELDELASLSTPEALDLYGPEAAFA